MNSDRIMITVLLVMMVVTGCEVNQLKERVTALEALPLAKGSE